MKGIDTILNKDKGKDNEADELLEGMQGIAKHIVERDEKTTDRFEGIEASIDASIEKIEAKLEKGLMLSATKFDRLAKTSSALSILGSPDPNSDLLEALSDAEKALIPVYESHIASGSIKSLSDRARDPIFRTAMGCFFMNAFKSHPALDGGAALARADKIHRAFEGAYGSVQKVAFATTDVDVGGNTVPTAIEDEMRRLILDSSVISPLATHIPMVAKTVELPKEGSNKLSVTVAGTEGGEIPDSVPATAVTDVISMTALMYKGRAVASVESLMDSAISIMEWIQTKLTEEFGRQEDIQALETGASSLFLDSDVNEIASGTNGDVLDYAMLVGIVFNAGERATRQGAMWFMPPLGMQAAVALVDSQGNPILQFARVHEAIGPNILGYPVQVHSGILQNRTKGTGAAMWNIYFGDPKAIVFGDRTGMTWSVSTDAGFDNDQVHMKLTKRTGIVIGVPSAFTRKLDVDEV